MRDIYRKRKISNYAKSHLRDRLSSCKFNLFGESGWIMCGMRQLSSSVTGPELLPSPAWDFRLQASLIVGRFRLAIGVVGTKDSS